MIVCEACEEDLTLKEIVDAWLRLLRLRCCCRASRLAGARFRLLDHPPKGEKPAMTADERLKLQKELIAARDRQASRAKARGGAASPQPMKP